MATPSAALPRRPRRLRRPGAEVLLPLADTGGVAPPGVLRQRLQGARLQRHRRRLRGIRKLQRDDVLLRLPRGEAPWPSRAPLGVRFLPGPAAAAARRPSSTLDRGKD